ncbi:MAG: hypothetical protein ACP5DX_03960 [Paracoccaceae bacterium]
MSGPVEAARAAWGDALPDWVLRLAEECADTSQNKAAQRIGKSGALVSQVLRNKYPAPLAPIEETVRGVLMAEVIVCPALGDLPRNECQDWRKRARHFSPVNTLRVRMFRACSRCPRNGKEG